MLKKKLPKIKKKCENLVTNTLFYQIFNISLGNADNKIGI